MTSRLTKGWQLVNRIKRETIMRYVQSEFSHYTLSIINIVLCK